MPYKDPEAKRVYLQRRRLDPAVRQKRLEYLARPDVKARRRARPSYGSTTLESTLEARRAYWEVQKALKSGALVRPDLCTACRQIRFCEAAHSDYSRPLDIQWLCRPCHRQADAVNPHAGKEPLCDSQARVAADNAARLAKHVCLTCGGWIAEHPGRRKYCSHPCYVKGRWG